MDIKDINLDIDSDSVITLGRSKDLKERVRDYDAEKLQILLAQAQTIEKGFREQALKNNAKWFAIYNIADDAKEDAGALQGSVLRSANKKRNHYGESIDPNFIVEDEVKTLLSSNSSPSKETINVSGENSATKEEEKKDVRLEMNLPGPSEVLPEQSLGILPEERKNWNDAIDGIFGKNNDFGELIKACVPCGIRKVGTLEFGFGLTGPWEGMADRLEDLMVRLQALTFDSEGMEDLCRLVGLLEINCMPDLFGLISLFALLQQKYAAELSLSFDGLLSSILGAILGPMLMNVTSTIDQYVDAIMNPIECVLVSLEQQLAKLDINAAENKAEEIKNNYNRRRLSYLSKRRAALERRLHSLNNQTGDYPRIVDRSGVGGFDDVFSDYTERIKANQDKHREYRDQALKEQNSNLTGLEKTQTQTAGSSAVIGSRQFQLDSLTDKERDQRNNDFEENVRLASSGGGLLKSTTRKEEIEEIKKEKKKIEDQEKKLKKSIGIGSQASDFINDVAGMDLTGGLQDWRGATRENIATVKQSTAYIKDSINLVIQGIYEGQTVVNNFLEAMKDELIRTVVGRVETKEDQIALTLTISKYSRLINIVKTLIELKKNGKSLKEQCENRTAMGNFIGNYRELMQDDNFNFYHARDLQGNDLLVVTPENTKVKVSGFENEEGDEDLLFGESLTQGEKTSVFNELNETMDLNKKGVLPDLGNIGDKKIEVEFNDSNMNLNISDNYVIMINDFCSTGSGENSAASVKNWINNL